MIESPALLTGFAFVFGLIIGSFLNVVILRLPPRMKHAWHTECAQLNDAEYDTPPPPGLVFPPSRCGSCEHRIRWYENIPVVSWLALRGKCSSCKTRISAQYPAIELTTGLIFALVIWQFGLTPQGIAALALGASLVALSGIDIREQLLPDIIVIPMMWLGLLLSTQSMFVAPVDAIIGAAAGYLILWVVYQAFKITTGKEGMGYGDFKLLAMLGAWMGWEKLPLIILLSSLVGALVGVAMIVVRGRDRNIPIPFGPYLAAAGLIAFFWGDQLIGAYLSQF